MSCVEYLLTDFNLLWVTMTAENKSISHVIWDWNGTLVDDSEFCASVVSAVLEEWNLPVIDRLAYRRQFRFPVREFYEELGFSGGDSDYLRVCDSFIKKYRAGWRNCSLQNGAMEVLSTLQKRGVQQIMLSAGYQKDVEASLKHFRIDKFFTDILGQTNTRAEGKVVRGKEWFAQSGLIPDRAILVGDTNHDWEVAEALGVDCLLLTNGHQDMERLAALQPPKINELCEVLELFT